MKTVLREWVKRPKALAFMLIAFFSGVIDSILTAALNPTISGIIVGSKSIYDLIILCILIVICAVCKSLDKRGEYACFRDMHNEFNEKLINADYKLFTEFSVASLTTIGYFMNNVIEVARNTSHAIVSLVGVISICFGMYIAAGKDVAILMTIACVVFFTSVKYTIKLYLDANEKTKEAKKERDQLAENCINGFEEIRSFGKERSYKEKINTINNKVYKVMIDKSVVNTLLYSVINSLDFVGIILIIIYMIPKIRSGEISVENGITLAMYVLNISGPLMTIINCIDAMSDSFIKEKDYNKIMNYENKLNNGTIELNQFNDKIEIKNVKFAYDKTSSVLRGVNMEIKKGMKIGICGKSGDGKSTLLKLLNHFYEVDSGEILIDGCNIKDLVTSGKIANVHQDNILFPDSIRNNILFGKENATETELNEACRKAGLTEFIAELKDGLETQVGPRGIKLSGGQQQRIALARMFIADPEIIILDEATSALDNGTEKIVQEAIENLGPDKTVITVAHRLSTIQNCDKIYVMDKGLVVESGTHNELLRKHGVYHSMYTKK